MLNEIEKRDDRTNYAFIHQEDKLDRLLIGSDGYPRRIVDIQQILQSMYLQHNADGAVFIPEFLGPTLSIGYVGALGECGKITNLIKTITPPKEDEIIMIPFSISLCGTDAGLISHLKKGDIDPSMYMHIAGHEAAGFIVGVGRNVDPGLIGQIMCLDSHYACGNNGHSSFDQCITDGCDGIVGGIRGSKRFDGARNPPIDGYWGRIIKAPASAMTLPIPAVMAEYLIAPSTLESLGNIYEIMERLKEIDAVTDTGRKILLISGLGATGYPLSVVAKHYGYEVVGIEPSEGNRNLAIQNDTCHTCATSSEAHEYVRERLQAGEIDTVITAVMSGNPQAYEDVLDLQRGITDTRLRKILIAFGLFSDSMVRMPGVDEPVPQREFVFGRRNGRTSDGTEVYGVCGRSMSAWRTLIDDLSPDISGIKPKNAQLVANFNAAILLEMNIDHFKIFAGNMLLGDELDGVTADLQQAGKIKYAVNLLKSHRLGDIGSYSWSH